MNKASQVVFQHSNDTGDESKPRMSQYMGLIISIVLTVLGVANFFALFPLVVRIIKKSNTWFRDILLYFFANPFFALKYINKSQ